jgi:hypothetical protein
MTLRFVRLIGAYEQSSVAKSQDFGQRLAVVAPSHRLGLDAYVDGEGWRRVCSSLALARLNELGGPTDPPNANANRRRY